VTHQHAFPNLVENGGHSVVALLAEDSGERNRREVFERKPSAEKKYGVAYRALR
jgi:hypothetical protein